jgi:nicotinamide-nucleotide amidase
MGERIDAELLHMGEVVGTALVARGETVAVAESSAGGLIAAGLLAVPGASAYFQGGAVVYTRAAKAGLLRLDAAALADPRPATEGHALILARGIRGLMGVTWGIGETGATGPSGNRYGDPPGHVCIAVVGVGEWTTTLRTERYDRAANMLAFAITALELLHTALREQPATRP